MSLFSLLSCNSVVWWISVIWGLFFILIRYVLIQREAKYRGRKMSAMTSILADGSFPPSVGPVHNTITNVAYCKELPNKEHVEKVLEEKLLSYRRFHSVPQSPYWRYVDVDVCQHIVEVEVENDEKVKEELERQINTKLNPDRPLWEVVIVKNRELSDSKVPYEPNLFEKASPPYHCVTIRIDHSIGDGVSLVEVFAKLMTDLNGKELSSSELIGLKRTQQEGSSKMSKFFVHRRFPFYNKLSKYLKMGRMIFKIVKGIPRTLAATAGPYDTETSFTGPLERKKKGLVWSSELKMTTAGPWSLAYIKRLKSELGVSVNDILLAAFSGAVKRYCLEMGDTCFPDPASKNKKSVLCRAMMPFAFIRDPQIFSDSEAAVTNSWTMISTTLSLDQTTRLDRVKETNRITKELKRTLQPLSNVLINQIGVNVLPRSLYKQSILDTYSRHSLVFANVPGPPNKVRIFGIVAEEVQILFGGLLPQVELFTYAGRVFFNFVANPKIITNFELISQYFAEELIELGRDLGMESQQLDFV